MMFTDFGLDAQLLRALEEEGYATPTPIQTQAIPGVLAGRDLLGIAQTGTGKTAAFALPILTRLAANARETRRGTCRVLILSPTRELATQIGESFRTYGRHLKLSVAVVFGGVGHRPQIEMLRRGIDILVATPGRLIDHLQERNLSLDAVETFVLDEADQMLDLGFIRPIRNIVSRVPKARQSLFFSATMPFEIGALAAELLTDPLRVSVAPSATTVERVNQRVIFIEQKKKRALLAELLANPDMSRTIVFTRTKRGADRVSRHLEEAGIPAAAIHGNKSQPQREKSLAAFRDGHTRVLVATDIAARGIDIDQVTHVINFELPEVPESYVHRIGRTARAGAEGSAIALVDGEERGLLRDIERLTRQQIPSEDRRGDETLTADARSSGGLRRDREGHREERKSPRNARSGGRRRFGDGEQRRDERGARGAGDERRPERGDDRGSPANGNGNGKANGEASRFDRRRDERGAERPHGYDRGRPEDARGEGRERQRESGDRSNFARRDDTLGDRPRSRDDRKQGEGGREARHDQNGRGEQGRPNGGERSHAHSRDRDRDHGARPHDSNDRRDGVRPRRNGSEDRPRDDRKRAPVRFGGEARSNDEGRDGHRRSEHRDASNGERPFRTRDNNDPGSRDRGGAPHGRDGRERTHDGPAHEKQGQRRDHGNRNERPSHGESRPHHESRTSETRSDRSYGPRDGARRDQRAQRSGEQQRSSDRNGSGNGGQRPFRPKRQNAERAD